MSSRQSTRRRRGRELDTQPFTERQWQALLTEPALALTPPPGAERRRQSRHAHHGVLQLVLHTGARRDEHPRFLVRARDLSAQGLGFVHSEEVRRGTTCELALLASDSRIVRRRGVVRFCARREDGLFTVGLSMDQPIDVGRFVSQPAAA